MMKKRIAVTPNWDDAEKRVFIPAPYFDAVLRAGALPFLLPLISDKSDIEQIAEQFDGFVFSGGGDISPELYGEERNGLCDRVYRNRDDMEIALFNEAVIKRDKAAFGICRGLQIINVALGGSLYQDLLSLRKDSINHRQELPYDKPYHPVNIKHGSPLYSLFQSERVMVNSYHHQGIKKTAPQLVEIAAAEDGLTEAVYLPNRRFMLAVQWHPEKIPGEESSRLLFEAFISAVDGKRSLFNAGGCVF